MACAWPRASRHSTVRAAPEGRKTGTTAEMGKNILVVDGSSTWRKMVQVTLNASGHEVLEAQEGAQGLELIKSEPIDIVLTGCQLPDMGGSNFTREIRSLPEHGETPVVVVSDSSDNEQKESVKSAGGTGWMVQPVMPEKLIEVVEGFAARIDQVRAKAKKKSELEKKKGARIDQVRAEAKKKSEKERLGR